MIKIYKIDVEFNNLLNEKIYKTKLENGLKIYICKKDGYERKIGMFGTKYGSLINHFIDVDGKDHIVPDGIAHFLEHKLFEKEEANGLDLFSKIGVNSNAYTSFDHTVFYFDTTKDIEEPTQLLIRLIKEAYFTDENVKKEQGIIEQEIKMYNDDPSYNCFFNTIKGMYQKNNIKTDILGTIESINNITKEDLYLCYNTFYNLNNMFFIIVGDVDIERTIKLIEQELYKYNDKNNNFNMVKIIFDEEPAEILNKNINTRMNVFMPQISIGYKLKPKKGGEIIKRSIITDIIGDMYFSRITDFYKNEYERGILTDKISLSYEAEDSFAHLIFMAESMNIKKLEEDIICYINKIKEDDVDVDLFEQVKNNKLASYILNSDSLSCCYRRIIDSILTKTNVYDDINILKKISINDIKEFLNDLNDDFRVISIVNIK